MDNDGDDGGGDSNGANTTMSDAVSLLNNMDNEIRQTLPAALIGLTFPNARDASLMALSYFRASLFHKATTTTGTALISGDTCTDDNHEKNNTPPSAVAIQSKKHEMARHLVWFVSKEIVLI